VFRGGIEAFDGGLKWCRDRFAVRSKFAVVQGGWKWLEVVGSSCSSSRWLEVVGSSSEWVRGSRSRRVEADEVKVEYMKVEIGG
jgi:hypothetical protein